MQRILFIATFLFMGSLLWAQVSQTPEPPSSLTLHLKISSMQKAQAPEVWNNYFILTYQERYIPRFVAVAFEHENYQILHKFLRNEQDVFVYYDNIPDLPELKYRIIVDGVWQADPRNPQSVTDPKGVSLSVLNLPQQRNILAKGPIYRGNGIVDFYLSTRPDANVFLVGDFTRWDPFLLPMKEIESGLYHVRLFLGQGQHHYYFLVNGSRMTDPANFLQKEFLGETVSAWQTPDNY
ncbi:hypothetical protein [Entomospira entomophila]|uniref:AMP-activated protein kinase glycogen-binding domain-containing protein n=2 Tax=Entomospira entomophila TaxID=2719988 RepID=A0A968GDQ3_9SPIO|nr:hypothetical protein [Entomospira entomophilus]NIZ41139.1 hypothetical protein [Entomospira entomophilus]